MSLSPFTVFGASGCGRGLTSLARAQLALEGIPTAQLVFVGSRPEASEVNSHLALRLKKIVRVDASTRRVVIAIANNTVRERLIDRRIVDGKQPWKVQAANAVVVDGVSLEAGAALSPFINITSSIRIGECFHANLHSYIEQDSVMGDSATFVPSAKCKGSVHIMRTSELAPSSGGTNGVIPCDRPECPGLHGRDSYARCAAQRRRGRKLRQTISERAKFLC